MGRVCFIVVSFIFALNLRAQAQDDDLRCVIDLALIADSSGSLGKRNFFKLKLFLKDITRLVNMGPQGTHIALVFFSTQAEIVSDFAEFVETPFNKDNIRRKIDEARFQMGYTFINRALRAAEEQVFRTEFGMRPHVKKVTLLITDGIQTSGYNGPSPADLAKAMRNRGIEIHAIGIGFNIDFAQLLQLVSRPRLLRLLQNFGVSLSSILEEQVRSLCSDNPAIKLSESGSSLFAGNKQSYICIVEGWPPPTVKWLKNNTILKEGKGQEEHVNLTLDFPELELHHTGSYTCEASNEITNNTRIVNVTVLCPPKVPQLNALLPHMGHNGNVNLSCKANQLNAQQMASYKWKWMFKNERELTNVYGKYEILSAFSSLNSCKQRKGSVYLHVENVTREDLGTYKCVLLQSNTVIAAEDIPFYQQGKGFEGISLDVPPRPEIVRVNAIDCGRKIEVEWKQATNREVTGYEVIISSLADGSEQGFNLSNKDHIKRFGVQSNNLYEIQIRAKNAFGSGLWSKQQLTTTTGVPAKFAVSADPQGCYANLSWMTPSYNSCPITRYTVHYRQSLNILTNQLTTWEKETFRESSITSYRLKLNCSSTYEVMVLAWNERGSSIKDARPVFLTTEEGIPFQPEPSAVKNRPCGTFEVTWNPPALDSGGGPLTGYQVELQQFELTQTTDESWHRCRNFLANHSCLFGGLQSETEYRIRVRALNQKGRGQWAQTSRKTDIFGPPYAPEIINNETEIYGITPNVTVQWTRPGERNCNITMYSLHFNVVQPAAEKVTEINISNVSVTSFKLQLQHSKKYEVTVFARNKIGQSEASKAWQIRTQQYVPYPIMHLVFEGGCNSINVTWNPPSPNAEGGRVTGYLAQIKPVSSEEPWFNWTTNNVSQSTQSCVFTHLKPNSEYHVRILAQNKMGYGWPSEVSKVSTIQAGVPSRQVFDVKSSEKENECAVFVQWRREPPSSDCPILFHTISYRRTGDNEWARLNITQSDTNNQKLETECFTEYEFQFVAWNEVGSSPSSTLKLTTKGYAVKNSQRGISLEFVLIYTFAGLLTILGAVLLAVCISHCRKKGDHFTKRTAKDIQVLDGCEIPPIRTEFLELLGEGAFGKVHKATLKDGMAYFEDERPRKQKIIAVKELFENAHEEERKEFMDEIELMKKVGKHQNVVSFFGCWTTTKPILLMVEYIAHGDLLHWLRHKRSQIGSSMLKVTPGAAKDTELYAGTPKWNTNVIGDQDDVSTEKKTVTLRVPTAKTRSAFDVMEQTGGGFYREEECKIPMLVSSASNQGTERVEDRPNNSEASGGPSSTPDGRKEQGEQGDFDDGEQCKIPMTVFWSSIQEENAAPKTDEKECDNDCETFHPTDAMSFAWQIARGMSYLSEKGLVHRDLAARNILVGHGKKLKIGDFGLMREMYHELYEVKKQKKLPIKWMAPEAIYEQIFTSKSDVWSYGIVMWEIATLGGSPYPLLNNAEVMSLLRTGHRLEKPDLCSDNFYTFMMECWKQNPDERPSFQELVGRLERTMTEQVEYLDLKQLDETKAYYQVQESKTGEIGGDSGLGMQRAVSSISMAV